jgi:hypothetical protein
MFWNNFQTAEYSEIILTENNTHKNASFPFSTCHFFQVSAVNNFCLLPFAL